MLALRRIQDEVREQVRAEAWAAMRARLRGVIAGLGLACLAAGVAIGYYGGRGRQAVRGSSMGATPLWACTPSSPDTGEGALTALPTPWPIRVYISGAVAEPRVIALPPGSLIADALEAAGGASSDADLTALNLAEPLRDHQHVQVPRLSSRVAPAAPVVSSGVLDINTATPGELETLPGIGPTRALEIIAFREAHGPFETTADLMKVPGIGPATYEKLAFLISVGAHAPAEPRATPFP